jgi:hypothetical protein
MDRVHGPGSWVHGIGTHLGSSNPRSMIRILCTERVSTHLILVVWARSNGGRLAPAGDGAGLRSWQRAMAERGGSLEFRFSRAMVVGFRRGLLLRDHNDEGNLIRPTLIGGGRQRNPATVRWLSRLWASMCAAFNGVPALKIGGKHS